MNPSASAQSSSPVAADRALDGYRAGLDKGLAEAQARFDAAIREATSTLEDRYRRESDARNAEHQRQLSRLEALLTAFSGAAQARLHQIDDELVGVAFEAVCKIVGEAALDVTVVARQVERAMASVQGAALLAVRLHPDDLDALAQHAEGREVLARRPEVRWIADPSIEAGGCVVDGEHGTLDARLDLQLSQLKAAWSKAASSRRSTAGQALAVAPDSGHG